MYNACNRLPRQGNGHLLPTDVFVLFFFVFFLVFTSVSSFIAVLVL